MSWKGIFEGVQSVSEDILFMPYDALRSLELNNWWLANIVSWLLMAIGLVAFVYWMLQLKKFNDNNEEDKSSTSHSFL
jgi:hypothetical protein